MKNSVRALMISLCVGSSLAWAQPAGKPAAPAAPVVKAQEAAGAVKLIDAGAEPRRALRYMPTKGDTFGFEIRMKMTMAMKMGERDMPSSAMPTMVMGGDVKVVDVMTDGNAKIEFVYAAGRLADTEGVLPQVVDAMEGSMSKLSGISGAFVFSPTGECVSGSFKVPDDADPMVRQTLEGLNKSMQQLTVPLPVEAVGKGAKWECERMQDTSGVKIKAVYTQELTDVSDKAFATKVSIKGDSPSQTVQGMKLESMKMSGGGTQQVSFARMMPTDCLMNSKADMTMEVPGQGKMSMAMDMTMSMKQTEAGKATPATAKPGAAKPDAAKPDTTKPTPKF